MALVKTFFNGFTEADLNRPSSTRAANGDEVIKYFTRDISNDPCYQRRTVDGRKVCKDETDIRATYTGRDLEAAVAAHNATHQPEAHCVSVVVGTDGLYHVYLDKRSMDKVMPPSSTIPTERAIEKLITDYA